MLEKIKETTEFIINNISEKPHIGIILGTGLGNLGEEIDVSETLPYKDIPNFPVSTVSGHKGQLIFGKLGGKSVVAMQGRFHYYEGYTMKELTFPIRVLKFLGIEALIISNAAGGMNPEFEIGDLMLITDHINLMPSNPLMGVNIDKLGPRFPDMSEPYCKNMIAKAKKAANDNNINYRTGVYAAVSGPTFETPAEYAYIRTVGADAVGMSTVPEVIVARHMDIPCFAISVITDLGIIGQVNEVSHEEVIKAAKNAEPKMTLMIRELIAAL